jgi:diguanylate cyclase (GGDEF)-like protein/PAS domain S-box-containing protein
MRENSNSSAYQLLPQLQRWLPLLVVIGVGYSSFALLDSDRQRQAYGALAHQLQRTATLADVSPAALLIGTEVLRPSVTRLFPDLARVLPEPSADTAVLMGTASQQARQTLLLALDDMRVLAEAQVADSRYRSNLLQLLLGLCLVVAVALALRSVSARPAIASVLPHSLSYGDRLFAETPAAVVFTDADDRIVEVNDAYVRLTGYDAAELKGRELTFNRSGQQDEKFFSSMRKTLAEKGRWTGELWLRNKVGEAFADKVTRLAIHRDDELTGYLTLSMDVAGTDDAKRLMLWQAHHDTLTKLPNRNLFQERLSRVLLRASEDQFLGALLSIDLDRFKIVNDSVGPAKGDQVLMEAAYRIAMCVRESDTVARLGGDHFVVLLSEIEDFKEVERLARQIVEDMDRPFMIEGRDLFITASIGVAVIPQDGLETGELLQKADAARIQIKQDGGNNLAFFEPEINARAERRMELESALRKAVSNGELLLHYQPVVDINRGVVSSTEALLRWQHPELGLVSPGEFIPIAEDTGLIVEIGQWVVTECQRQLASWRAAGMDTLRVSLNVSAIQLRYAEDVDQLLAVLESGGAEGLTLELTESALIDNSDGAQAFLRGAKKLGCAVALDDFGTGFSSLGYLRNFDFDVLKIDKTFIDELANTRDYGLVASIVSMGRILGMKVVAEGVEEAEQVERLKQIGCDYIQGFYYSKPLLPKDFQIFVDEAELRDVG